MNITPDVIAIMPNACHHDARTKIMLAAMAAATRVPNRIGASIRISCGSKLSRTIAQADAHATSSAVVRRCSNIVGAAKNKTP